MIDSEAGTDPKQPLALFSSFFYMQHKIRFLMKSLLTFVAFFMAGCVNVPLVEDDVTEPAAEKLGFSCAAPFELTQDCSSFSYASRKVSVHDKDMRIAASTAGDVVFVTSATPWRDCVGVLQVLNPFVWNCPKLSKKANAAYVAVRDFLSDNGMTVERTVPRISAKTTVGYYLILDSNGYELLKSLPNPDSADDSDDLSRPDRRDPE